MTATTNRLGQVTRFEYYAAGTGNASQLRSMIGPTGKRTYYQYNARGQPTHQSGEATFPEYRAYGLYGELTNLVTFQ